MKLLGTTCVLLGVGLMATGCGDKKGSAPAPVKAPTHGAAAASTVVSTNGRVPPPKYAGMTREQRIDLRAKQHQALLDQTRQVQQQSVTNLLDLARQMYAVEAAARTNNSDLQAAYEAMSRARDDYEARVAALPEMKPLVTRREELQEVYRRMSERKQLLEQEKTTP